MAEREDIGFILVPASISQITNNGSLSISNVSFLKLQIPRILYCSQLTFRLTHKVFLRIHLNLVLSPKKRINNCLHMDIAFCKEVVMSLHLDESGPLVVNLCLGFYRKMRDIKIYSAFITWIPNPTVNH